MKRKLTIYLGLIISVIFIILILRVVDFHGFITALAKFNLDYIPYLLALYFLGMILRTVRWRMLLDQSKAVSFGNVFDSLVIGFMVNNILPAKIGEFLRAEYISRREHLSRSFSLGTVFAERMFDILLMVIFLFVSVIFSKSLLKIIHDNVWLLSIIILLIALVVTILLYKKFQKRIIKIFPKKYQKSLEGILERAAKSLNFLRRKRIVFQILILSIAVWLLVLIGYFVIFRGMGVRLPIYGYFFIVSAGAIGMVIPSTSANIGVYDAVVMGAIILFTVNRDTALAIAVIAHVFDIIPSVVLGLIILAKNHLSLFRLREKFKNFPS